MKNSIHWLWLALFAALPLVVASPYTLHIFIITGIFIIGSMSLNLLLGYTGQLNLGQAGFFGIGAYASALISLGFEVKLTDNLVLAMGPHSAWFGLLGAILLAGFFGWVIGKISFKIRGAYFVIVTIGFAEVMRLVALNWVSLTQGPMALNNIPPFTIHIPGVVEEDLYGKTANYYIVLIAGTFCYIVIRRLIGSRIGRAMIALRENEQLAKSVGINVTNYLVLASVISAAIAGAAGSFYAHYMRIIDPDVFLFIYTVTMVIMVITGGKGTLMGPIVGGVIFGVIPDLLRSIAGPEVQWIIYGCLMIAIVFFLPQGIVPAMRQLSRWRTHRSRGAVPLSKAL